MTARPPGAPGESLPEGVVPVPSDAETDPSTRASTDDTTLQTENRRLGDGVNRCSRCGSTEIQLRPKTGMLICLFCRHEWSEALLKEGPDEDLASLTGTTIGSGASDIDADTGSIITLKCAGCGSEVVVNTENQVGARCHWCRHVLTVNEQVPNGAVPDAILPFKVTHAEAVARIEEFAGKRRIFANREFVKQFTPENVLGVYMPYLVVDGNVSVEVSGYGEVKTRQYTRGSGNNAVTVYDADVYRVRRQVDFTVDDLTLESSARRANLDTSTNTNNVINTILPFDTQNAVKWNASYLTGFTSEKRDQDVAQMLPALEDQLLSIGRSQVSGSISRYNRGVRWEQESLGVHGTRWIAMYLPVWLYSHYQDRGGRGFVHYIAVNGRTGETMGSIPISRGRLIAASLGVGAAIEIAAIAAIAAGG